MTKRFSVIVKLRFRYGYCFGALNLPNITSPRMACRRRALVINNHNFSCTWKTLLFGPPIAFNTVLCVFLTIFDPSLLNYSSHILTLVHICIDPTSEQNNFAHFVQLISIMHYFGKNLHWDTYAPQSHQNSLGLHHPSSAKHNTSEGESPVLQEEYHGIATTKTNMEPEY